MSLAQWLINHIIFNNDSRRAIIPAFYRFDPKTTAVGCKIAEAIIGRMFIVVFSCEK